MLALIFLYVYELFIGRAFALFFVDRVFSFAVIA